MAYNNTNIGSVVDELVDDFDRAMAMGNVNSTINQKIKTRLKQVKNYIVNDQPLPEDFNNDSSEVIEERIALLKSLVGQAGNNAARRRAKNELAEVINSLPFFNNNNNENDNNHHSGGKRRKHKTRKHKKCTYKKHHMRHRATKRRRTTRRKN